MEQTDSQLIMQFGRYRGKSIKRVPDQYLAWMVWMHHPQMSLAKCEIRRREIEKSSPK